MSEVSNAEVQRITPEAGIDMGEKPSGLKDLRKNRIVRTALLTVGIAGLLRVVSPLALGVFGLASAGEYNNMGQGWKS